MHTGALGPRGGPSSKYLSPPAPQAPEAPHLLSKACKWDMYLGLV